MTVCIVAARLFPAQAGVILAINSLAMPLSAFPRASGGDPCCLFDCEKVMTFSPRKRG